MKIKNLKTIVFFLFAFVIISLSIQVVMKINQKNQVSAILQIMPKFLFKTLENKDFSNDNLNKNLNTVFIYFNTECEYCKDEAKLLSNKKTSIKNIEFIFVSSEAIQSIKQFASFYNLDSSLSITFLQDSQDVFYEKFNASSIPYILIYNKKRELLKAHKGQLNFEYISNLIE